MKRRLPIFAVVVLYAGGITVGCALYYLSEKQQQVEQIDRSLLAARLVLEGQSSLHEVEVRAQTLIAAGLMDAVCLSSSDSECVVLSDQSPLAGADLTATITTGLAASPQTTIHPTQGALRSLAYTSSTGQQFVVLTALKPFVAELWTDILKVVFLAGLLALIGVPVLLHFRARQQALMQAVVKAAHTDALTGLPNKQQLLNDLAVSNTPNLAFIKILNYNSFVINHGPAVVSDVIRQFATVLSRFHHPQLVASYAYRVEPSTFAILEDQDMAATEIAKITAQIVKSLMAYEYQIGDGEHIRINVVVGGVNQKADAYTLAKMALQEAEHKKLPYYFINKEKSSLPAQYRKDQQQLRALLDGLKEQRLKAFYHPIFAADGQSVAKYECLARLVDQQGAVIMMPDVFLPLAHRANVYYKLTRAMVMQAIDFALRHQVVVSVNINVSDINNKKTRQFIYQSVQEFDVGPLLEFELLEDEAIINTGRVIKFMLKIQQLGAKIGMDDLGKGYSNIERLLNLPIDFVKIDKTIMENLTHNLEMQSIAKSIIRLAHKKHLKVTAEYCADKVITQMAIDLGADYLQGFYLARPGKDLFEELMAAKHSYT